MKNLLEKIFTSKSRSLATVIISIFVFVIVLIFHSVFYLYNKDIQSYLQDKYYKAKVSKEIIIVEIDDKTTSKIGRFPFDRSVYADVLDNLRDLEPAVVAFDIIFSDKTDEENDNDFSRAIKESGNVVLGLPFSNSREGQLEEPLDIFDKYAKNKGYFRVQVDNKTKKVYSIANFFKNSTSKYESFSISILKSYYSHIYKKDYTKFPSELTDKGYSLKENLNIESSREGKNSFLINYSERENFNRVSFYELYYKDQLEGVKKRPGIDNFKDKIVIIGATAKGIKDVFETPQGTEYGVFLHGYAVNTVLSGAYLKYLDTKVERLLIFLLILTSVYFNLSRSGKILTLSNIIIIIFFSLIFPAILAGQFGILINYWLELLVGLVLSLAFSNILKYFIENKDKKKLNKALSEYVSVDVAKKILSGEGNVNLEGESKKVAIFFSDIEGFTSVSEKFTPEKLVGFLREYLSSMSHIILDRNGFINKYEGDAIMALWGVFDEDDNVDYKKDSYDACTAALKQQDQLYEENKNWGERGFDLIKARIGLHRGDAIIGNIGAEGRKMEFTALGDSVNLASRLESVNKQYGTYICASDCIYEDTKDDFEFRYLDKIRVKGKSEPTAIYELICIKGKLSNELATTITKFNQAIKLYQENKFKEALEIFKELENIDGPSKAYTKRCKELIKTPPEKDWDGVWTMNEK